VVDLLYSIFCNVRAVVKCVFLPQTSELGVTEHIEGDECKFAVWTGRAPISDYRIVLKVSSHL
jgi:triple functional domain protein